MFGERKEYPLTLQIVDGLKYKKVTVKNDEDIIQLIEEVNKDVSLKKVSLAEKCKMIGLTESTLQLFDIRTVLLFQEYLFYMKAPHTAPYDSELWFTIVLTLNPIFNQRLF